MICFAKPVLTEDMYTVHKEEFPIMCYMWYVHLTKVERSIFIRDKPVFPLERVLHKDYDRKGSVGGKKISGCVLRGLAPR
jgi:hypothetical protein